MDYIDYREKLGLAFNDKEKQQFFMTRVLSYFYGSSIDFSLKDEKEFCKQVCIKTWYEAQNPQYSSLSFSIDGPEGGLKLSYYLSQRKNEFRDFLAMVVFFLNIYSGKKTEKEKIWKEIESCLKDSHIQYELLEIDNKTFIFPKGAKELDMALVSEPLEWLSAYPSSRKAFVKALKLYSNSSDDNASDVADSFRKSLETFFQEFFVMPKITIEKVLEKGIYGKYLEENNIPKELRNDFFSLLDTYKNFMNNYAKHHDKTSKNVLEYIMYQTGNIIRLLITLKMSEE